jgi:hypothetical protein
LPVLVLAIAFCVGQEAETAGQKFLAIRGQKAKSCLVITADPEWSMKKGNDIGPDSYLDTDTRAEMILIML